MDDSRGTAFVALGRATAAFQRREIRRATALSHEAIDQFRALRDPLLLDQALAQLDMLSRAALRDAFPRLSRLVSFIKRSLVR